MQNKLQKYFKTTNKSFLTESIIIYIEDEWDDPLNVYIQKNFERINEKLSFSRKQLFYYPSCVSGNQKDNKALIEFIRYRSPLYYSIGEEEMDEAISGLFNSLSPKEFYDIIKNELSLREISGPALLKLSSNEFGGTNTIVCDTIEYENEQDIDRFFSGYIKELNSIPRIHCSKSRLSGYHQEYDADRNFDTDGKEISYEIRKQIEEIVSNEDFDVLAGVLLYILETMQEAKPEIIKKVKPLIDKRKLLELQSALSRMIIDEHYHIYLADYGNMEVKMHPLPKTVYILFLSHPEGIRFKELYLYKKELLAIYNKITNQYDKEKIEKAVDELVDMTNPSINQKCSRIREAFRKIMDEDIARYYYIDGSNGEPKKILLPERLIEMRF